MFCATGASARATGLYLCWVFAFALLAVFKLSFVARCATAVTFIPTARTVIVHVVAPSITDPIRMLTTTFVTGTLVFLLECRVFTLALRAINPLSLVAAAPTTVTTIPITAAIVVVVVTSAIRFVVLLTTYTGAFSFYIRGVFAFTILAVLELPRVARLSTAVAFVPVAAAVIVLIVTTRITKILYHATLFLAWATSFGLFGVFARTLLAI